MRIFDRKFMQYQLAYGIYYTLTTRFLFLAMVFAAMTFFTNNFIYLGVVPLLYIYGYVRLQYLLNAGDEAYEKRMEKQYRYYERKNEKAQGKGVFQLEKLLFAVELGKKSATEAVEDVREVLKIRPKLKATINGILLSLYIVRKEEEGQREVPQELLENMHAVLEKEENPNALVDYVKMALRLEKYDLALQFVEKAEKKKNIYRRQRQPIYKSIYKVLQVSLPFYKGVAYFHLGKKEEAREALNTALKLSHSRKLKGQMQAEAEKIGIQ